MPLRDFKLGLTVERLNNYSLTRPLLNGVDEFALCLINNVPEFSFAKV
jgi:hypothetical protein